MDETSEERCEKKTEVTICLFVTSGFRTNKKEEKERHKCLHKNKRKRERERERTRSSSLSIFYHHRL